MKKYRDENAFINNSRTVYENALFIPNILCIVTDIYVLYTSYAFATVHFSTDCFRYQKQ